MRTLIRGGTVVNPTGPQPADVLIDGETIAAVLSPEVAAELTADEVIDATGRYVIPGGVDVHTHMQMPFGGTTASDTFETGTAAAAWGGTTTIIDFAIQPTGEVVQEGLARWHAKAAGDCAIDYGFHMILGGVDDDSLKAMDQLVEHEGITSFKLFMAYPGVFYSDDGQILRAMQQAAGNGAIIMMHAENGIAIDVLAAQAVARGDTEPLYHGLTRPAALEAEATHRAIALAEVAGGTPLYIVHMSASEALAEVSAARTRGANVFAETCPQYLYLTLEDQLGAPGFEGAKWVCSTPLRSKHEPHAARPVAGPAHRRPGGGLHRPLPVLHEGPEGDGPRRLHQDPERDRRRRAPHGPHLPGRRRRQAVAGPLGGDLRDHAGPDVRPLPAQGRHRARLGRRRRGLRPGGGDPLSVATHHMNMDYSAYEGCEIAGSVRTVLSRGTG